MSKALSVDLRSRVVAAVKAGANHREAAASHIRRHAPGFTALRPPRVVSYRMAGRETRYNSGAVRKCQDIEIKSSFRTEPNRARFARFETKAVQRPNSCAAPVSEVRSASANPFETWDKSDALSASLGVRD